MSAYNKTQLTPQNEFERHIYHRDQFAHYFRWTHVLKHAKIGQRILDFGCGSGEMLEVFYRNRYRPERYLGLDIRESQIEKNIEKFQKLDFAEFRSADLCQPRLDLGETFDIITCFEVIEHIGHANADAFLENIVSHCTADTTIYLSTPNYDERVGAAKNHMLGDEIGEWDHFELQAELEKFFTVQKKYGTFASMRDYKPLMNDWQTKMFETLSEYYDTNLLANLMAPMFPENSRNTLWVLKLKENADDVEGLLD